MPASAHLAFSNKLAINSIKKDIVTITLIFRNSQWYFVNFKLDLLKKILIVLFLYLKLCVLTFFNVCLVALNDFNKTTVINYVLGSHS